MVNENWQMVALGVVIVLMAPFGTYVRPGIHGRSRPRYPVTFRLRIILFGLGTFAIVLGVVRLLGCAI